MNSYKECSKRHRFAKKERCVHQSALGQEEGRTATAIVLDEKMRNQLCEQLNPDGAYAKVRQELEAIPPGLEQAQALEALQQRLGDDGLRKLFAAVNKALEELQKETPHNMETAEATPSSAASCATDGSNEEAVFEVMRADRIWAPRFRAGRPARQGRRSSATSHRSRFPKGGHIDSSNIRTRQADKEEASNRGATLFGANAIDEAATLDDSDAIGKAELREQREMYEMLLQAVRTNRAREFVVCVSLDSCSDKDSMALRDDVRTALSDWLPVADALVVEQAEFEGKENSVESSEVLETALPEHALALRAAVANALECDENTLQTQRLKVGIESQDSFASVFEGALEETVLSRRQDVTWALKQFGLHPSQLLTLDDIRKEYLRRLQLNAEADISEKCKAEAAQRLKKAHDVVMSASSVKTERIGSVNPGFLYLGPHERSFEELCSLGGANTEEASDDARRSNESDDEAQEVEVGIALRQLPLEVTNAFKMLNQRHCGGIN